MHNGGHYSMSMSWTRKIYMFIGQRPYSDQLVTWTDSIHLTDSSCYIHGHFNFDSRSDIIKPK